MNALGLLAPVCLAKHVRSVLSRCIDGGCSTGGCAGVSNGQWGQIED